VRGVVVGSGGVECAGAPTVFRTPVLFLIRVVVCAAWCRVAAAAAAPP